MHNYKFKILYLQQNEKKKVWQIYLLESAPTTEPKVPLIKTSSVMC